MNRLTRLASLATFALCMTAAAHADEYSYSYTFSGNFYPYDRSSAGHTVSGTFDGNASGNLITGISNATVNLDGSPLITGTVYAEGITDDIISGPAWADGAAVVSFDGTQNDFGFSDTDYAATSNFNKLFRGLGPPVTLGQSYYEIYNSSGMQGMTDYVDLYYPPYFVTPNGIWTVTDLSTQSVPDAASTLPLLGGALAGLAALRRRFAR
jgi:hypothetical protein